MSTYFQKNRLNLIIVDFDNTLFFTNNINFKSYKKTFNYFNAKLSKKEFNLYAGLSKRDFYKKIFKKKKFDVNKVFDLKKEYYKKSVNLVKANYLLLDFLRKMKNQNVKIALVSNASRYTISLVLNKFSIENFFDAILTSDDVEKTKPNPTAFKKILKKFKATSKNVIVIDDDKSGIIAAKKCNIQSMTFNPQKKN
tara:strand:+ start:506 stop:1093 length:588 start_codon:yes stop_codon:yes gene_type:complete